MFWVEKRLAAQGITLVWKDKLISVQPNHEYINFFFFLGVGGIALCPYGHAELTEHMLLV